MAAEAGGVMSIISDCEKDVEVVEEGRIGIWRGPVKLVSVENGFRANGSAVRFIVCVERCSQSQVAPCQMRMSLSTGHGGAHSVDLSGSMTIQSRDIN